jgi:hypothetical protein
MKTLHTRLIGLALISGAFLTSSLRASDDKTIAVGDRAITQGEVLYDSKKSDDASQGWKGIGNLPGFAENASRLLRIPAGTKNVTWGCKADNLPNDKAGVMLSLSIQLSKVPESIQSGMGGLFDISIKPEGDAPSFAFTLTAAYLRGGSWFLNGLKGGLKIPNQTEKMPFEKIVISTGAAETSKGPTLDTDPHELRLIVLPGLFAAFWDEQLIFQAEDPQIAPGNIALRALDPGADFESIDLISLKVAAVSVK